MCGIVGFTGKNNSNEIQRLLSIISHRGRDGQSYIHDKHICVGMNRLAIIDMSPNLYPMRYKHLQMVFNGEIYNFHRLKTLLKKQGIRFKTGSDAEVILPLYHLYGSKSFQMLEGMFAICIYDKKRKKVLLVRDKSGEKPLYYCLISKKLFFASEMKVLLNISEISHTLNTKRLAEYFTHGFVQSSETLIPDIKKLTPSSYITYTLDSDKCYVKTYWNSNSLQYSANHNQEHIHEIQQLDGLLRNAVNLRMISDVPVGCFLSGGIDSSLITYYAAQAKEKLHTFSIRFPGYETYDESRFSTYVANSLKTYHTTIPCTADSVIPILTDIGSTIDEPIVDPAFIPTLLLAREARKYVKVVLTGEGADELFGGYSRYIEEIRRERIHRLICSSMLSTYIWKMIFRSSHDRILLPLPKRYSPQHVWNSKELQSLKSNFSYGLSTPMKHTAVSAPLTYMLKKDYRSYLVDQLLNKVDKATMSANLEARAPYLDTKVIEFAHSLPDHKKINYFHGKIILKQLAESYFPKSFIWRPKHGFELPLTHWFKKELKPFVYDSLDRVYRNQMLFSYEQYKNIVQEHMDGSKNHTNKIWSMITLTSWIEQNKIGI